MQDSIDQPQVKELRIISDQLGMIENKNNPLHPSNHLMNSKTQDINLYKGQSPNQSPKDRAHKLTEFPVYNHTKLNSNANNFHLNTQNNGNSFQTNESSFEVGIKNSKKSNSDSLQAENQKVTSNTPQTNLDAMFDLDCRRYVNTQLNSPNNIYCKPESIPVPKQCSPNLQPSPQKRLFRNSLREKLKNKKLKKNAHKEIFKNAIYGNEFQGYNNQAMNPLEPGMYPHKMGNIHPRMPINHFMPRYPNLQIYNPPLPCKTPSTI